MSFPKPYLYLQPTDIKLINITLIFGNPIPAPKPISLTFDEAVEYPSCIALLISAIPGLRLRYGQNFIGRNFNSNLSSIGMCNHVYLCFI